jgi:hypothetical protein
MPYIVNGQLVPEELVREEFGRIGRDPQWHTIPDLAEHAKRLHAAAEQCAQGRLLIQQAAMNDQRPIDPAAVKQEIARQNAQWGCRGAFDYYQLRQLCERNLRIQRIRQEMVAEAENPTAEEAEAFFSAYGHNFPRPELFHASVVGQFARAVG